MEIKLKVIKKLEAQEGFGKNGNPWIVQPYIGETFDQYPRKVAFEVFGKECIDKNPCEVDDVVNVSFDIESREYNGRWYTSIRAWKITKDTEAAAEKGNGNVVRPEDKVFDAKNDPDLIF